MSVRRWIIRGRVQGVGFRWFVMREAERLKLGGVARNLPDGSVEVISQGPETALEALEKQLRRGPSHARVDEVQRLPVEVEPDGLNSFEIE